MSDRGMDLIAKVEALCCGGNVLKAISLLSSFPEKQLSEHELKLLKNYQCRFVAKSETFPKHDSDFVDSIYQCYRSYWNTVLTSQNSDKTPSEMLFSALKEIALDRFDKEFSSSFDVEINNVFEFLSKKLENDGWYSLFGKTVPHFEFMLWNSQTIKEYNVKLHDRTQKLNVVLLNNFVSLGWAAYATFDKIHTGGWATSNELYCVVPAYDLTSEEFQVSYLAHESRHFSDYKEFPKLKQAELEYRAKLTELIHAKDTSKKLVNKFLLRLDKSKSNPHGYANYMVLKNISTNLKIEPDSIEQLRGIDYLVIQKAALDCFEDSTKLLTDRGSKSVTEYL